MVVHVVTEVAHETSSPQYADDRIEAGPESGVPVMYCLSKGERNIGGGAFKIGVDDFINRYSFIKFRDLINLFLDDLSVSINVGELHADADILYIDVCVELEF